MSAAKVPIPTDDELAVMKSLVDAWNRFQRLPAYHPWDQHEFMEAIHACQNILLVHMMHEMVWLDKIRP